MDKLLSKEEIEAEKKVPPFQVGHSEGICDLKAAKANIFDQICDQALAALELARQVKMMREFINSIHFLEDAQGHLTPLIDFKIFSEARNLPITDSERLIGEGK